LVDRETYWALGILSTILSLWLWTSVQWVGPNHATPVEFAQTAGAAGPNALIGSYHRLFTATLAHLSPAHLVVNLVLLWIAGLSLGRIGASMLLILVFLVAGWVATIATILYSDGLVLGASAGIFGVFGALVGQLRQLAGPIGWGRGVVLSVVILVIGSLGYGDIVAHWSGFFVGVLLGSIHWRRGLSRWVTGGLILVACVASAIHWCSLE